MPEFTTLLHLLLHHPVAVLPGYALHAEHWGA